MTACELSRHQPQRRRDVLDDLLRLLRIPVGHHGIYHHPEDAIGQPRRRLEGHCRDPDARQRIVEGGVSSGQQSVGDHNRTFNRPRQHRLDGISNETSDEESAVTRRLWSPIAHQDSHRYQEPQ